MDHHLLDKNFTERSHPKGTQEYPEDPILNKKTKSSIVLPSSQTEELSPKDV